MHCLCSRSVQFHSNKIWGRFLSHDDVIITIERIVCRCAVIAFIAIWLFGKARGYCVSVWIRHVLASIWLKRCLPATGIETQFWFFVFSYHSIHSLPHLLILTISLSLCKSSVFIVITTNQYLLDTLALIQIRLFNAHHMSIEPRLEALRMRTGESWESRWVHHTHTHI